MSSSSSTHPSSSSILPAGTVQSRGNGSKTMTRNDDQIAKEIQDFVAGRGAAGRITLNSEIRAYWTIWMFLTRLPCPSFVDLHPGVLMRGMVYFPLVGACIGFTASVVFDTVHVLLGLPPVVAAIFSTASSLVITGCFHEDGLADSADGIGGGWTRSQILLIMTDSRVGTYGCAALVLYLLCKVELLAALGTSNWMLWMVATGSNSTNNRLGAGPAVLIAHCVARATAPYLIRTRDYVDDQDGPKSSFYHFIIQAKHIVTWPRVGLAAMTGFGVTTAVIGPRVATILVFAVLVTAHLAGRYGERVLGGVMGDFLGATICITELVVLSILYIVDNKDDPPVLLGTFNDARLYERIQTADCTMFWEDLNVLIRQPNHPLGVLTRFMTVLLLVTVWYACLGPSSSSAHDSPSSEISKDKESSKSSSKSSSSSTNDLPGGLIAVQKVCQSVEASFGERHEAVRTYIDSLAKPVGSLGTLEEWAARLAALQQTATPTVDSVACLIFAADHGAAKRVEEGGEACSAFPQVVTQSILKGLERGIAGASVLARANNVKLKVVDVGVVGDSWEGELVSSSKGKMEGGTLNFCSGPAMTTSAMKKCLRTGRDEFSRFVRKTDAQAVVLGEVGIGNTTSSSALIAHFTGVPVKLVCGGGATTGRSADDEVVRRKIAIVNKALKLHKKSLISCQEALARLGGAEIAALVGAILQASEEDVALLIDGFIVTAAALVAVQLSPKASRVMFLATRSGEKGQAAAIEKIQHIAKENGIVPPSNPALDMGLRMGEATGGLSAVPLLRVAAAMMYMGTIEEILADQQKQPESSKTLI